MRLGEKYALRFFPPGIKLAQLTPRHIANFVGWLCDENEQGRRLADATVRNALNPVRSCLGTAMQEGLIRSNPAQGAALPYRPDPDADDDEDRRALSREELAMFLRVVNPSHRVMFRLLACTGLRVSEALALQAKHLDLEMDRRLTSECDGRSFAVASSRRRHAARRSVPLDAELVQELRRCLAARVDSGAEVCCFRPETGASSIARTCGTAS